MCSREMKYIVTRAANGNSLCVRMHFSRCDVSGHDICAVSFKKSRTFKLLLVRAGEEGYVHTCTDILPQPGHMTGLCRRSAMSTHFSQRAATSDRNAHLLGLIGTPGDKKQFFESSSMGFSKS